MENNCFKLNKLLYMDKAPVIIFVSAPSFSNSALEILKQLSNINLSFSFYELIVDDWDMYLTPWEYKKGNRFFGGKCQDLLRYMENELIPYFKDFVGEDIPIYIAGYSLGGLASLYSLYVTDLFDGSVSCSGSLWYPGWKDFVTTHSLRKPEKIYLSLGDKEKNTKDSDMKNVFDNTSLQRELLENDSNLVSCTFELNPGGHFNDMVGRMTKGISWILTH